MKKLTFTCLLYLFSVLVVSSQTVIDHPTTGLSLHNNSTITKVELTDTTTIMSIHTKYTPGWWIRIPKETYIQPVGGEKLFIKRSEGIPLNEQYTMPASGEVSYVLTFPAIPKSTQYIDYGEANESGSWFIYDIATKPNANNSLLPKGLNGNWFDKTSGQWEFGFYDKYVVYNNKLWSYSFPKDKKSSNSIKLTGNGKTLDVFYKITSPGTILLGLSAQKLKEYSSNATEAKKIKPIDDKPYELPVFKIDSATYSGYIKDYTPRVGVKTLSISIDDIITGNQNNFIIRIDENGFFSAKLPIYYPHVCFVRSSIYNGSIFLEPGKELFQLIGNSNPTLFMGESARINSDMTELMKIRSFDYWTMRSKILDMTPAQYKTYCLNCGKKDINALDSIMATNTISTKAYQVMKLELKYGAEENIMSYDMNWESAYCEKNKIPRSQKTLPVKSDSLTADYFDFISNESANNPFAVLSSGYNSYINRLKYLDILRIGSSFSINTQTLGVELEKSGYTFTPSEKLMFKKLKEADSISNSAEEKTYNEKYSKQIADFNLKYKDTLQSIFNTNKKIDNAIIKQYFKDHKIKLATDEKTLWKAITVHDNSEKIKKMHEFYTTSGDSTNAFHKRHMTFINEFFAQKSNENRNKNLKTLFGLQNGLAVDVMLAQDYCRNIVEEVSPVSDIKLKAIQQQFSTPFVAEYVALCNNQSIAKLEANKKKTGFVVNETPKTEADKIFDAIIKKYKGKIIYVDFWATWCGPCRSGIEQIKQLKEELAGKDIVFVYITDQSSPQSAWSNMIPDIKGEHYRVSTDEWNYLKAMFNVSGIPHYVLVGKMGEVINPNFGHYDNGRLKIELEKYIKE
ncbi:MAG: thioredoxin family protein [Paludibacter sp.]|nr:thioredoxin family protein [Paludibacter sp.]